MFDKAIWRSSSRPHVREIEKKARVPSGTTPWLSYCASSRRAQRPELRDTVASGVHWRKLTVPNADRFERAGIYYACTTVEGFLHQDQEVAVVGAGNSAGQAAMFLAEHGARTVHMLIRKDVLGPGMSDYLGARIRVTPSIIVHTGVEISEVHGTKRVGFAVGDGSLGDVRASASGVCARVKPRWVRARPPSHRSSSARWR